MAAKVLNLVRSNFFAHWKDWHFCCIILTGHLKSDISSYCNKIRIDKSNVKIETITHHSNSTYGALSRIPGSRQSIDNDDNECTSS